MLSPAFQPSPVIPDHFLGVLIPLHILVGALGAFLLCPLAAFSRKRGKIHRMAGRLFLLDVGLVVFTGTLLLLDPLFLLSYWKEDVVVQGYQRFFDHEQYPELFFLYLNLLLAYSAFSAARVWPRIGYGAALRSTSSLIDWMLALIMLVGAIAFFFTGILDMMHDGRLASLFVVGTAPLIGLALIDIYTFVRPPQTCKFPWLFMHLTKMMFAWAGLLNAFYLRLMGGVKHLPMGTFLWFTFSLIGYYVYYGRFVRKCQDAPNGNPER